MRKLGISNEVYDEQKARETWFLICNDRKQFCAFHPHGVLSRVVGGFVIDGDGDRWVDNLSAANSSRCFTGSFTELSESELPNSMVTGVT